MKGDGHLNSKYARPPSGRFFITILAVMGLQENYPAYGGRGPGDLQLGLGLGSVATLFMILRVYVRMRVNKFGTTALILSLLAWVWA